MSRRPVPTQLPRLRRGHEKSGSPHRLIGSNVAALDAHSCWKETHRVPSARFASGIPRTSLNIYWPTANASSKLPGCPVIRP
jgi:hypothetical protein